MMAKKTTKAKTTRKAVHARVFSGELKPDQVEEAVRAFRRDILPKVRKIRGFRRHNLMISGNKFMWLTTWVSCPGPGAIEQLSRPVTPHVRGRITNVRYAVGIPSFKAAKKPARRPVRRPTR